MMAPIREPLALVKRKQLAYMAGMTQTNKPSRSPAELVNQRKTRQLFVRLSPRARLVIRDAARGAGESMSEFVLRAALARALDGAES